MDKPWQEDGWMDLSITERHVRMKTYLSECPGWVVRSHELGAVGDYDLAWDIDETGGCMWICHHGNLSSPNRPCDLCCEEMERLSELK